MVVGVGDVLAMTQAVSKLAFDVLGALEQVKNMEGKTKAMAKQVEFAGLALEAVEARAKASDPIKQGLLGQILGDLATELNLAHEKVTMYQEKSARNASRNKFKETAKAYWTLGATKQNKQTDQITEDIRKLLVDLNQALSIETHASVHEMAAQLKLGGNSKPCDEKATPHPVVLTLDERALSCLDNNMCKVEYFIADSHSNDFRVPSREIRIVRTEPSNRRGAREGGIEIKNFSKLLFVISVEDERYLNVVINDNQLKTPPELFFPKSTSRGISTLSRDIQERQFPNATAYSDDPESLRLEKDANLPSDAVAMQSVYVVLTPEEVEATDEASKVLTLEDLEDYLDDEDVFVKRFLFDIK